jgi:hypothetical protein
MARPKIKNKKPRVNMTLDSLVVREARLIADQEGVSLSELVETLLDAHNKTVRGERKTRSQARIEEAARAVADERGDVSSGSV